MLQFVVLAVLAAQLFIWIETEKTFSKLLMKQQIEYGNLYDWLIAGRVKEWTDNQDESVDRWATCVVENTQ